MTPFTRNLQDLSNWNANEKADGSAGHNEQGYMLFSQDFCSNLGTEPAARLRAGWNLPQVIAVQGDGKFNASIEKCSVWSPEVSRKPVLGK